MLPFASNDLPTDIGRAILHASAYLVFQLPGFTSLSGHPEKPWALTPRFQPYLCLKAIGGMFSAALSMIRVFITGPLPVRKRDALRCPDFPLSSKLNSDRTACIFLQR